MKTAEEIKEMVKETYGRIAEGPARASACCGTHSGTEAGVFNEDYSRVDGYVPEADLGLGCGMPLEFSRISSGDTVVDLGSGAGNDAFIARRVVGEKGRVIGVDMTEQMIDRARLNGDKLGYNNVEFRMGEIEKLPIGDGVADVVVSNCVLNLVPDKAKAFSEIFRILKPGGHFAVSDIVLSGQIPEKLRNAAAMYAGCVSGALEKEDYLASARKAGFADPSVVKERVIELPEDLLRSYLTTDEIAAYRSSGVKILSVTVTADKPGASKRPVLEQIMTAEKSGACCGPECCN